MSNLIFNASFTPTIVNNELNYQNGGIWIENNPMQLPYWFVFSDFDNQPPLYVYSETEAEPPLYIYQWADYWQQTHYIIWVPTALAINELKLKATVNLYNCAGKHYVVQYY